MVGAKKFKTMCLRIEFWTLADIRRDCVYVCKYATEPICTVRARARRLCVYKHLVTDLYCMYVYTHV